MVQSKDSTQQFLPMALLVQEKHIRCLALKQILALKVSFF